MNLRHNLSETVALLDKYPQIQTDKISKPILTALKNFRTKFDAAVSVLEEIQSWETLKSQLVKMQQATAYEEIKDLDQKDFLGLCKILNIRPKATKKMTSRQAGEAKLSKKIDDIRRQTY